MKQHDARTTAGSFPGHRRGDMLRAFGFALLLLCMQGGVSPAAAHTYGFLIGVSAYPNLAPQYQLEGPDNDVDLARETLIRAGVAETDITVLKSRGAEKPTRDNIIKGLQALARKAEAGDIIYLHYAGHGSQQPARTGDTGEGDGLDEIILPEDVGKWQDEIGAVDRAVSDNEFDALLTNIRRRGAFVWAVFDSCHSGTMLRSVSRTKWRNIDPSALGVPRGAAKTRSLAGGGHYGRDGPLGEEPVTGANDRLGGFVAFYAAQTNELAPELELPAEGTGRAAHGLFSYALAEAMQTAPGASYRQLGQIILQRYVRLGMRATTPLIEGTDLDTRALGRDSAAAPRQWPVILRGGRNKQLFVPAGALNQIGAGALFALIPDAAAPDEQAIGHAVAAEIEPFGAELRPVAHAGKPAIDLAALPKGSFARLVSPTFRFQLRVALPAAGEARTEREQRLALTLAKLAAEPVAADAEGLRIDWVAAEGDADIRLVFSPPALPALPGLAIAAGSEADCPRDRLWFIDPSGALVCNGPRANLSFEIGEPTAAFDESVRTALTDWLAAIGKVRNLEQMVGGFEGGAFSAEIDVKLFVKPRGAAQEQAIDPSQRRPLMAGDAIRLEVVNNANGQVDLTVLFVDSRFGITPLFPAGGQTNRIERGEKVANIGGEITADTQGLEGLIVIASKAAEGATVADFSFLGQKQLQQKRLVRSASGPKTVGTGAAEEGAAFIDDLIASAGFRAADRPRTRSVSGGAAAPKTPYRMVTLKSLRWVVGDR